MFFPCLFCCLAYILRLTPLMSEESIIKALCVHLDEETLVKEYMVCHLVFILLSL